MSVFAYKAIDHQSSTYHGTLIADSARQARDLLRSRGLRVRDLVLQRERDSFWSQMTLRRIPASKVSMAIRELSTLLSVGMPIVEAIQTIAKQHKGAFHTSLLMLKDRVAGGASLAEAMREQPGVFDELSTRMIEVGENAGNLDEVLQQLADFKERSLQLKDRVLGALLYPAIVFATSLLVTLFMMTVVVPMLLSSLVEAGRPLPWPTKALQTLSNLLVNHGFWAALLTLIGFVGLVSFIRTSTGRRMWHTALLRTPILGQMLKKQTISRLSMVISTLMRSGMEYLKAMEIAAKTTTNVVIRNALESTKEEINAGRDIGAALEETEAFPAVVIQVFAVGQETGRLEEMLDRLSTDYDRQVASLSTRLASVLEPALILLLAVFVGFILFATLLPILEAGNVL